MGEHRQEKQYRSKNSGSPDQRCAPRRVQLPEGDAQVPGNQKENKKPAPINNYFYAKDFPYLKSIAHFGILLCQVQTVYSTCNPWNILWSIRLQIADIPSLAISLPVREAGVGCLVETF